jgi:anti-sigma factor RsiW
MRRIFLIGLLFGPALASAQSANDLADQNKKLMQQLEATRTVITVLDARAAEAGREKEVLAAEMRQVVERNAALERELDASAEKTNQSSRTNEQLRAEMEQLRQTHQRRVADLESKIDALQESGHQPDPASESSLGELDDLQYRSGWIAQLLGYHRGFVDASRNLGISAREEQASKALTKQITATISRNFEVPDLTAFGMPFVDGHVTPINGVATGRILYRNAEGTSLEVWLVQRSGQRSQVYFGENDDLKIVHWAGADTEFALIGTMAWGELAPIAGELYQRYGM